MVQLVKSFILISYGDILLSILEEYLRVGTIEWE